MGIFNVTTADVEARWRALSVEEESVASVFITDLEDDLALRRPTLRVLLDSLATSPIPADQGTGAVLGRVVTKVIALAIKRLLRNPDLLRNVSIGADGSIGIGYENDSRDEIHATLSAADLADIDGAVAAVSGELTARVGSVRLQAYPERVRVRSIYTLPTP